MKRVFLIAVLALAGCAHPDVYDKPGTTKAQFQQDAAYCQSMAVNASRDETSTTNPGMATPIAASSGPNPSFANFKTSSGNVVRERNTSRSCMQSKGYKLRPQ